MEGGTWDREDLPLHARPNWDNTDVVFTNDKDTKKVGWIKPAAEDKEKQSQNGEFLQNLYLLTLFKLCDDVSLKVTRVKQQSLIS